MKIIKRNRKYSRNIKLAAFDVILKIAFASLFCYLFSPSAATTVIKYPSIIEADIEGAEDIASKGIGSDLHFQVAISHLALSLRCTVLTNHYKMDLHFHLSQAYIARLQILIDRIPRGIILYLFYCYIWINGVRCKLLQLFVYMVAHTCSFLFERIPFSCHKICTTRKIKKNKYFSVMVRHHVRKQFYEIYCIL